MRATCGCYIDGDRVLHGLDGPCGLDGPEPTDEELCEAGGHAFIVALTGFASRCYCGKVTEGDEPS